MMVPKAVPLSAKLLGDGEGDSGSLRPHNEHIKVCVDGSHSRNTFKGSILEALAFSHRGTDGEWEKWPALMVSLELGVLFLCAPRVQKIQSFPINISLFYSYLLCPQYRRGGPIIAVQVENEYGSYNMDKKYMAFVKTVSALLLWSVILWRKHIPDACSLSGTVNCVDG